MELNGNIDKEQKIIKKVIRIDGMTCTLCEARLEKGISELDGIISVKVIYSSSNLYVTFDEKIIKLEVIHETIQKLGYSVKDYGEKFVSQQSLSQKFTPQQSRSQQLQSPKSQSYLWLIGTVIIIFAIYLIVKRTIGFEYIPTIDQSMSFGILFIIGLITSIHCIAMCGGICLSQCIADNQKNTNIVLKNKFTPNADKIPKFRAAFLYNAGRVLSYTVIGGVVGSLGTVIGFSGRAKGIVAIVAGIFMLIMGINMLNIFPWLKKLTPRIPRIIKIKNNRYSPFVVGLLNGLMPCGPLQAMQIYALGTGSFVAGAFSMFLFGIGTVPLMFVFGTASSLLSSKFTQKIMKVCAMLVMILGIIMLNRGLGLSGIIVDSASNKTDVGNISSINGNVQVVTTELGTQGYAPIIVQKGIPVKWTINADEEDLTGCNYRMQIPEYGLYEIELKPGENIIEFTPDKEGKFIYTCWMGMISSSITVVD